MTAYTVLTFGSNDMYNASINVRVKQVVPSVVLSELRQTYLRRLALWGNTIFRGVAPGN